MQMSFGRNKSLPKRPPKVPRRVEIEHALRSIREQEKQRFTHEWLVGGNNYFLRGLGRRCRRHHRAIPHLPLVEQQSGSPLLPDMPDEWDAKLRRPTAIEPPVAVLHSAGGGQSINIVGMTMLR